VPLTQSVLGPPSAWGGVFAGFKEWREGQGEAYERLLRSTARFPVLALPTGIGKSLVYMVDIAERSRLGKIGGQPQGCRALVLTATKGLQAQVSGTFLTYTVMGMNNYACRILTTQSLGDTCDNGPCLEGEDCQYRRSGCSYYDRVAQAGKEPWIDSNYAFWMTQKKIDGQSLGRIDVLVCDEAHELVDQVCNFMRIELESEELHPYGLTLPDPSLGIAHMQQWRDWAKPRVARLRELYLVEKDVAKSRAIRKVGTKLATLEKAGDDWVFERSDEGVVALEPLWPAKYMEEWVWRKTPRVVLSSATIRPKTLELLGLGSNNSGYPPPMTYDFIEMPSPLPVERRPVYVVPSIRMRHTTTPSELAIWAGRIDQIIKDRLDRKGIVHTVSYARAEFLREQSDYRDIMFLHTRQNARKVIQQFRDEEAPRVLVSPSVETGWDFPDDLCRYIIIAKVPFADTRSQIVEARMRSDREYQAYQACQKLVQMAGRGMRGPTDSCEIFVVDEQIKWLLSKHRGFFPEWFLEACKTVQVIPPAPLLAA
jgi:ATP-dependent DNA helicase DinG